MEQNVAGLSVFEQLWAWFEAHKKQVALSAGIAALVGVVAAYYLWSQSEKEVSAGVALSNAMTSAIPGQPEPVETYLKVAASHPGTGAGAQALLNAGAVLFTQGKYAEAQAEFQKFGRDYPNNTFRGQALLGVAASYDAMGKTDDAARTYKEIIDRHPGDLVVPQAKLSLARVYESQNKLKEARDLYEDVSRVQPFNSLSREAMIKLEEYKSKQPTPASAAPATTKPQAFPMLSSQSKTNAAAKP